MRLKLKQYNFQKLYRGVVLNRQVMFTTHHKSESKARFVRNSLIMLFLTLGKMLIASFMKKKRYPKQLGINWSAHKKRTYDYDPQLEIVDYFYKRYDREQIRILNYASFTEVFRLIFLYKKPKDLPKLNNYGNYFQYLWNAIEFSMMKNLILENKLEKVVINGLNDRYCLFIGKVCELNNIELAVVQHGAFTKFEGCQTMYATEFHYMYDFSAPFLKYFFTKPEELKLVHCPNKKKLELVSDFEGEINIAYACTPSNVELNFQIIDIILKGLSPEVNVIIHPHPRENDAFYAAVYDKYPNVTITKQKYRNMRFLVTRISSLGVELKEIGIEPVFINLEGHETDFLHTGEYQSFTDLEAFETWITSDSAIKNYYHGVEA
ncbi:MAG: hypothetical protein ACO1O6_01485 [Bacteroidota bacterium]